MSQIFLSLATGAAISAAAAYLGSLMLCRRMALVAGPLGHLTLPGIALALVSGFDVSLGAFPFVVLGVFLIWLLDLRTKLPTDALTAIVFASGVGIAFLFLPIDQAEAALIGDITKVGLLDSALTVLASCAVMFCTKVAYSRLILCGISEDLAASEGIDAKRYELLYLFLISVVVALGVKMVGGLLTAALVAIPASTARNLARSLKQFAAAAVALGVASAILGILLAQWMKLPSGPAIILVGSAGFLLSLPFAAPRQS